MRHTFCNRWLGGVLALALAASAPAQAVHVVAGDGSGDFLQLQAAVDAAADGDVILVRPHTERYEFTIIAGKPLTIVGDGDVRPAVEDMLVAGLAADEVVTLRFLDIEGRREFPVFPFGALQRDGLELDANEGSVWLEDLVVAGANGIPKNGGFEAGLRGLVIESSNGVVVVDSEVFGGQGFYSVGGTGYDGGDAGLLTSCQVALHGSTFLGGAGGTGFNPSGSAAGQGGIGLDSSGSILFASGSSLSGGDTGDEQGFPGRVPTASGLRARDVSTVNYLATTFAAGGGPAPPGEPISIEAGSTADDLDDAYRAIKITAAIREEQAAQLTYTGQPGDQVLLRISAEPDWSFVASLKGVQHLGAQTIELFLGGVGRADTLDVTFRGPGLPPGVEAVTAFAQPIVAEVGGGLRLGGPSSVLIVDGAIAGP